MRLDGSLEDFSLPDVLQLLAQTHKSGALHLHATQGQRRGVIRLGAGSIDGACSDIRRQVLARRLVGAGLVSDDALGGAAEDVRAGAPSLLRALLERAALPHDEVTRVAADQATDAVCELLRWSAGTFSFLVGESDPDGLVLGLRAEELVAEGMRRMQVWPALTSHIPSPDTVLRLAVSPAFDPSCTREEWGLLALVDGDRSVSEIVGLLGRSEFALAGALAALVERGLLTVDVTGSGLADLQRRQAIIAGLEAVDADVGATRPPPDHPAPVTPAVLQAPAAAVPIARDAVSAPSMSSDLNSMSDMGLDEGLDAGLELNTLSAQARAFGQPMSDGSAALDTAPALTEPVRQSPDPAARGLDAAVTKSLVLRLIAGVRGL